MPNVFYRIKAGNLNNRITFFESLYRMYVLMYNR